MSLCYPHGNGVFQQENCTSNKSRLAIDWLDEHSSDFFCHKLAKWKSKLKSYWVFLGYFGTRRERPTRHTETTDITE
ncbi:hypothetical protein TNCV_3452551 [Trichonephila clavipes]|nr:hypothetical protein TNCV_3452551 [Trichonephila clavipes]